MPSSERPHSWPALASGWTNAALVAWIFGILAICFLSLSRDYGPPSEPGADKVVHFLGYLSLALLPHAAFSRQTTARWASSAMILLGVLLEIAQGYVPGRFSDPWDALANTTGVICGLVFGLAFRRAMARIVMRQRA